MPLGLRHPAQYGRETFIVGNSNREAFEVAAHSADPVVLLIGPAGSGKTHLAHIWAARRGGRLIAATELAGAGLAEIEPGSAYAVEDIDAGGLAEAALFHLINAAREAGGYLLATARETPATSLPDLQSRLRLARPATLLPPDDLILRPVLVKLFADRQLVVEKPVVDFLLPRIERSFSAVAEVVDLLDHEALAAGQAITRPMAARILAEIEGRKQRFMEFE